MSIEIGNRRRLDRQSQQRRFELGVVKTELIAKGINHRTVQQLAQRQNVIWRHGETTVPEGTLAIVLGASEFPEFPGLDPSSGFRNAAEKIGECLYDKLVLNLHEQHLLWLFDSDADPNQLDRQIATWLDNRTSTALTAESQLEIF